MGGRNLATYPRCPKCGLKRDVGRSLVPGADAWNCYPCDLYFTVRDGQSVADGLTPIPADIKRVFYCHIHYREHLGTCPSCAYQQLRR